jgi:iron complex transport system substrate-binding protein
LSSPWALATGSSPSTPRAPIPRLFVGFRQWATHGLCRPRGVLSLRPTLILATTDAGPPAAIDQLRASGVSLLLIPAEPTLDGVRAKVWAVARSLGLAQRGEALIHAIEGDLARAAALVERARGRPRVLFLLGRLDGTPQAAGTGTAADAMIRLAGGTNAVSGYAGYRPLTPEAAVAAAPDVLLATEAGLVGVGGAEALLTLPGFALTPAGRARRVVAMDALYLLGFGPRVGQAALELARRLHPELQSGRQ